MLEEIKGWRVSPGPGLSAGKAWAPAEEQEVQPGAETT